MLLLPFSLTIRWYSCHPLFLTYSVRRNLQRQSGSFVYLFCVHTQSRWFCTILYCNEIKICNSNGGSAIKSMASNPSTIRLFIDVWYCWWNPLGIDFSYRFLSSVCIIALTLSRSRKALFSPRRKAQGFQELTALGTPSMWDPQRSSHNLYLPNASAP